MLKTTTAIAASLSLLAPTLTVAQETAPAAGAEQAQPEQPVVPEAPASEAPKAEAPAAEAPAAEPKAEAAPEAESAAPAAEPKAAEAAPAAEAPAAEAPAASSAEPASDAPAAAETEAPAPEAASPDATLKKAEDAAEAAKKAAEDAATEATDSPKAEAADAAATASEAAPEKSAPAEAEAPAANDQAEAPVKPKATDGAPSEDELRKALEGESGGDAKAAAGAEADAAKAPEAAAKEPATDAPAAEKPAADAAKSGASKSGDAAATGQSDAASTTAEPTTTDATKAKPADGTPTSDDLRKALEEKSNGATGTVKADTDADGDGDVAEKPAANAPATATSGTETKTGEDAAATTGEGAAANANTTPEEQAATAAGTTAPTAEGDATAAPETAAPETDNAKAAAEATAPAENEALNKVLDAVNGKAAEAAPASNDQVSDFTVSDDDARSSNEDFLTSVAKSITGETAAKEEKDNKGRDLARLALAGMAGFAVGKMINDNQRVDLNTGDRVVVTNPDGSQYLYKDDDALLFRPGSNVQTEKFNDGSTITTVARADGSRVVTIRDARMNILRRSVVYPDGQSTMLIDDTTNVQPVRVSDLPPAARPVEYSSGMSEDDLRSALMSQSSVDRRFTLGQIRNIAQVRALVAPLDIQSITFDTGSAAVSADQAQQLSTLGSVIAESVKKNPNEIYLIEGYTDAIGSDASNLALSDRRAESVALALTEYFKVPPENMVVQGYGEQFLRVQTDAAERANRRVAVRRITDLVQQN